MAGGGGAVWEGRTVAEEGAEARARKRGQRTGKDKKGKDEEGLKEGRERRSKRGR